MALSSPRRRRDYVEPGIWSYTLVDGRLSYELGWTDKDGAWETETVGPVPIDEARAKLHARQAAAHPRPRRRPSERRTVGLAAEMYLSSRLSARGRPLRGTSPAQYKRVLRNHVRTLPPDNPIGDRLIRRLEADDVVEWIEALSESCCENTIACYSSIFSQALQWAVRHGWCDTNAYLDIDPWLRPHAGHARQRIPTAEELARLLAVASIDETELFQLAYGAGPRRAEMAAVTWERFDADGAGLLIVKQLDSQGELRDLKSTAAERVIDLAPDTVAMLRARRERLCPASTDFIFADEHHRALLPSQLSAWFRHAADRAGLNDAAAPERLVLHSLRHLYATMLFAQPELSDDYISRQLGHSSPKVTRSVYRHLWVEFRRNPGWLDGFDELLRRLRQDM